MPLPTAPAPEVIDLGVTDYSVAWARMRAFTAARTPASADALWLTEHPPVFTLGQAGDPVHVLAAGDIPVVRTDRGGQVTFHGPGQIVVYVLFDLARRQIGVRALVRLLENAVIGMLAEFGVAAEGRVDAPGVYVAGAKIASIGLRVRQGRCYHGLAFNARMDLEPFARINACGHPGLVVTDARALGVDAGVAELQRSLVGQISHAWSTAGEPSRPGQQPGATGPAQPGSQYGLSA
jgi:lipoyl(octanoyl) transferase